MRRPTPPNVQSLWAECHGEQIFGVLHPGDSDLGVVVVVGGPQYRVGSHRQFVHLARALAGIGITTLRFDMRGMGDSTGKFPGFDACEDDIRSAVKAMMAHAPNVRRIVLWGLCDGASAALLYVERYHAEPKIVGVCLVNPWVRSSETLAKARVKHYYLNRLFDPTFWRKFASGKVNWRAPLNFVGAVVQTVIGTRMIRSGGALPFQRRMRKGLDALEGEKLIILSGRDLTAAEFQSLCNSDLGWREAVGKPSVSQAIIEDADHTFSDFSSQEAAIATTIGWLQRTFAPVCIHQAHKCK